ncbi:transporter substrate-binding domain-containing protein [Desulfobacter curvatus]|uniref:transporter substrate-binding domain-containing protein n=1 Tax=Desulfobacter curvatus TaxID=2290 RepID=UPI000375C75F|nr:transporter substrate-binding domain-containing protein [Desulfobacter curvatus]
MRHRIIFFTVSILFILSLQSEAAENTFDEPLSIAIDKDYAPLTRLDVDGKPAGLFIDIWNLWSKKTGKEIVFIPGAWEDTLRYLKNGQASIHSGLFYSDSRSQWMAFSQPFFGVGSYFFYPFASIKIDISDTLSGIKIGVTKGSFQEEYAKQRYPESIVLTFTNREKMIRSVLSQKTDCLLSEGPDMASIINRFGMSGHLKTSPLVFKRTCHAGVLKHNSQLLKLVDDGFNSISNSELAQIEKRWISDPEKQYYRNDADKMQLTDIEKAWILEHPKIRVGFPSNFPPLFYNEGGVLKGVSPDHLKLVSTYSGLKFDLITIPAKELDNFLRNGTIDMSVGFEIPERKNIVFNTLLSMKINLVVVGRNEMPVVNGISAMKGKTIAIVRGIEIFNKVLKAYPDLRTYPVNSFKEAIDAVVSKKADVLMGGMLMVGHLLYKYPSLKLLGPVGTPPEPYGYLVNHSLPELVSIMDKTIRMIPKEDVDAVIQKWFKVQIEQKINWTVILGWVGALSIGFTIIILLLSHWNKKLTLEIKDRKQAEKALKISESRLKNIIENSTNLFYSHTSDHKMTFVSPQVRQYLGYEPEEVMECWTDFITDHPMNQKAMEFTQEAIRTGKRQPTYELEMQHKSGRKLIVEVREAPLVENGSVTAIVGSLVDITERKQAEEALRASHERFLTVLNSIDATIYVADMDTYEILFMNKFMINSFGRDFTGEKCWEVFRGETLPCNFCTNNQLVDENGNPDDVCVWQDRNPLTCKWYVNHDRAIEWTDGRLVRIQIATDITELKEMEKKYQQSQKMEAIGQLAGGIAHDFNNILYPIIGFIQLSQKELPKDHPVQEKLTDILDGAKRARDQVKRILHFSRQQEPELKPTILQPVIKETLKLLRSTIPANINLTSDLYDGQDAVLCDDSEIHEILLNLCTNAYHAVAGDQGDIVIGLDKGNPSQELDLPKGEYLCLSVKDNGIGIPESIKDKIFEPYVTTKEVGKGSGLGLSVVYGIVQNCNGGISVESSHKIGTIFKIYLPITDQAFDIEKKDSIGLLSKTGNEHILLVDDEEPIVKLGIMALEDYGYRVTGLQDSTEALDLLKANPDDFDLVITDMAMPKMIGTELSQRILEIRPDIPVIICSGYSEKLDKEKAKDLNVSKFLDKPLLITDLIKSIEELLENPKG